MAETNEGAKFNRKIAALVLSVEALRQEALAQGDHAAAALLKRVLAFMDVEFGDRFPPSRPS